MLAAPFNANGRPNTTCATCCQRASILVQGSRGEWTIDFGLMALEEAALYEMPFEYVRTACHTQAR